MECRWMAATMALVVVLSLSACGDDPQDAARKTAPASSAALTVQLAQATQAPLSRTVTVSGTIAAWQEMQLGVELSGVRIADVLVEVGDQVRRGDVLVTLDARTLDSELRMTEAALNEARAGILLARSQLDRGDALKATKLISAADHDQLRAAMVQAEARAQTAAAQHDAAKLRRDFATLRAPDDGVIATRTAEPGSVVMAGAQLLTMIRNGRLEWRAELSETDLLDVRVGAAVEVRQRDGALVQGRVRAVSPALDARTRTGSVHVDLPDPGQLRSGMFAEGRIRVGEVEALTVPVAAVVRRDGYAYVFTMKGKDRVERRRVTLGRIEGDRIEVRSGVQAGERVVSRGGAFLADGDLVRVSSGD
ncbi:MAG TPA: efflux RND transporter periplasmic adaptor subunit [Patescibacteria group bacterium]|nr:efflux RND transporter periplasmic adaptor subunit [Patescibacteria group bacterium]